MTSWILELGDCKDCGYKIIVTQGKKWDYRYYCSNPDCKNHTDIRDLGDTEDFPEYVKDFRDLDDTDEFTNDDREF